MCDTENSKKPPGCAHKEEWSHNERTLTLAAWTVPSGCNGRVMRAGGLAGMPMANMDKELLVENPGSDERSTSLLNGWNL